ncbi:class I SAM-dependent methyltransferase [Pseudidiomarina gelatinasegens]|uniref:Class I SAM-dependent methyltransferase n=1 Tax=Pseudidiomarina gelatinasegens TaxID=2487740 RepID=A0A443YYE0_9GAMM|nr:class I SAM-dependent methyltransferase [Pseudidiomarina gelatinasegens]RWU09141.1 class I SAM-dependent methyltransferase [Pseudidiomarina gelatinasegens]
MPACPLCNNLRTTLFYQQQRGLLSGREYYHCEQCQLVHVPQRFQLDSETEKSVYDLHENNPNDPQYRQFLARIFEPMIERLDAGACGLDFGSGPGPTLSSMFAEAGMPCTTYDIYYDNRLERLQHCYDYVVCTEVIEHVAAPLEVFNTLIRCLKPGGYLGIMTQRWLDAERFKGWTYRNDPTHIGFFHERTFRYLAIKFALELTIYPRDVVIFRKPHDQG